MDQVRQICEIARDLKREGVPSLRDLRSAARYREIRPSLAVSTVRAAIEADPTLIEDWERFSDDKRTKGGWAFGQAQLGWEVWQPFPEAGLEGTRLIGHGSAFAASCCCC